jgi:hypothetical protein
MTVVKKLNNVRAYWGVVEVLHVHNVANVCVGVGLVTFSMTVRDNVTRVRRGPGVGDERRARPGALTRRPPQPNLL